MIATMMPRMNPAPLLSESEPPPGVLTLTWPIRPSFGVSCVLASSRAVQLQPACHDSNRRSPTRRTDEALVRGANRRHERLRIHLPQASELPDDTQRGRRLVAPGGIGPEVRRIGLDEEGTVRELRRRSPWPDRRAECDRQREADDERGADDASRHLRVAAERVEDATTAPREQRSLGRLVRLAVVDENRQVAGRGERELAPERLALHVRRREVAVEVESDLPDRSGPLIGGQRLETRPRGF